MSTPNRFKPLAAVACTAALVVSGAGMASAQGSLAEAGSSAVPVFDSPSTVTLEAAGEGAYSATYHNRSTTDLACAGFVLPEDVAREMYAELRAMDFSAIDDSGEQTPAGEALNEAMLAGNFAIMLGEGGIGVRDYARLMLVAQWEEEGYEYTEEELDEYVDQLMTYWDQLDETFGGQGLVNFVNAGQSATWSAEMSVALPEGKSAGGIVVCFDGIDSDLSIAETTYVEIEHAEQGVVPSAGVFGSAERILGSAS